MEEAVDSTFELPRLSSRWVAVGRGGSSSALEATRSHFTRSDVTSERSRSRSKPPGSLLSSFRAAGKPPRASWSRQESSPRHLQAREYSRKLEKTEVGATWGVGIAAPEPLGITGASIRLHERSSRLQDGPKGVFREAQDGPMSIPGDFKTSSRAHQKAQDGPRVLWEASGRLIPLEAAEEA